MSAFRIFPTRAAAARYELACWLIHLRRRAAQGDGTLTNIVTRAKENVAAEWVDDLPTLRAFVTGLTAQQVVDLRARLDRLPIMGRRNGQLVTDSGYTLRWAEPRQTAAGTWAVVCPPFDPGGVAEPAWPPVPTPV